MVGAAATAVLVGGVSALTAPAALADTAPADGIPPTVSAQALPTWQVNGVVWSSATVGNTVYAVGSFTKARPAGVAPGGAGEIDAANILAFDITTGERVATFNHTLDAQALAVTASPDGSRIYVGGDFTAVDGKVRKRIAAFDTATGALNTTFKPAASSEVRAIAVKGTGVGTVYFGGLFTTVNGVTRTRLASVDGATGVLSGWAPSADKAVWAMALSASGNRVVVGGRFANLNGVAAYGLGAVDATTGATQSFPANSKIRDAGSNSAITSLRSDGTHVFGSGYSYSSGGNFEGSFALDGDTGQIVWANDCQGDTYDVLPMGPVVYTVSHAHNCAMIGEFPQTTNPTVYHRALAFTKAATGVNSGPNMYGNSFKGVPASRLLHWYPDLTAGSFTGSTQAAWALTGNSDYVVLGGEFTAVNGVAQQGLTRFAVSSKGTNASGPRPSTALTPTLTTPAKGSVALSWKTTWDYDNATLTYSVLRDGTSVYSTTASSSFWKLPALSWTDATAPAGTHSYRIAVSDPFKNTVTSAAVSTSVTLPTYAPVNGGKSTYLWNSKNAATVVGSSYTAGTLSVTFSATGTTSLPRPESTCVNITAANGTRTKLSPASVALTTDKAGAYAGTLTYGGVKAGTIKLTYACRSDYSAATVGTLS